MSRLDAAVIGAGAVGLATAARLARPGKEVAVLERHRRHGLEASSRSSEVVHAGLYYPPGSLKARLCRAGLEKIYALGAQGRFGVRKTGKLVVAASQGEVSKLLKLKEQADANGARGMQMVEGKDIPRFARGVRGTAALWSPESGIMDTEGLMDHVNHLAQDAGAMVVLASPVVAVDREEDGWALHAQGLEEPIRARVVINAAGLHADKVAAMAGLDVDAAGYRLHWFKGDYFSLRRPLPPECLVYPVPARHGLGVHLTLDLRGGQRLGPDAYPVDRLDYAVDASKARDFFEAASPFLPDLRLEDLAPGTSGIRAKLAADGSFRDFVIREESARGLPGWVNLIGIESPGLTASLAIADFIGDMLEWRP